MMETIRVNMTPCEDIKTIHASQNDGEARQWGFELHNNGDVIDASEVTDQITFKAYKGGTEQLLPENGSTPATSPFFGDIRYPQGLLSGQEFTYRQSPTEEDGLAKITDIKGNTLGWNQLVENGDFSTSSGWTGQFATVTISNNVASVRQDRAGDYVGLRKSNLQGLTGHKYLVVADVKSAKKTAIAFYLSNAFSSAYDIQANTRTVVHAIITVSNANTGGFNVYTNRKVELAEGDVVEIYHVMCFDLTKMGLESITDPSDFTSLFSLPYYSYNQGTLLSFNGNGIKTVGKNLLMPSTVTWSDVSYVDGYYECNLTASSATERRLFGNWGIQNAVSLGLISGTYIWTTERLGINTPTVSVRVSLHGTEDYVVWSPNTSRYINADDKFFILLYFGSAGTYNGKVGIQFELGSTVTSYEPYTESVINLPISTYFPSGMKDVPDYTNGGKIYDELAPSKAIARVGSVDLGTLDWSISSSSIHIFRGKLTDTNAKIPNASNLPNALLANYQPKAYNPISANDNGYFAIGYRSYDDVDVIVIIDSNYSTQDSFISHISGQYLYYELATPIETSFTTASLVTENAEIPLSNDDGVLIGKCTEELSSESGFFDAKIKLADEDGECYSNKIQLHIERSPQ